MKCPSCEKEMRSVAAYGTTQTNNYVMDEDIGKYYEIHFPDADPDEQFCCNECGKALPQDKVEEFLNLVEEY